MSVPPLTLHTYRPNPEINVMLSLSLILTMALIALKIPIMVQASNDVQHMHSSRTLSGNSCHNVVFAVVVAVKYATL